MLGIGNLQAANVQAAFAGQSVNSKGLAAPIINELGLAVQPVQPAGKNAYARGTGAEVGLLTTTPATPDPNQILLAGLAEANAPPPQGPVVKQIGPIPIGTVAFANLLRGTAQATFDPRTCVIGKPITYGKGEAAGLQLLNTTGSLGPLGELLDPILGLALPAADPNRNASDTRTFSYLAPNGDGTFALVSETRQTIAPVDLLNGLVQLELLGEWVLRATATGKPGTARVDYAPVGAGPTTPVVRLTVAGGLPLELTLQQIFTPTGFVLNVPGVADIRIGAPPRPIGNNTTPQPPAPVAADGTSASGAVDVAKVEVLGLLGGEAVTLRLGHMEVAAVAPAGGIKCEIPVSKVGVPDPVIVGNEVTITISIPNDQEFFRALFDCDLVNIRAVDTHRSREGNVRFEIRSASNGGVISGGNTVTWDNLGSYRLGDPPIKLQVVLFIPANSPAGVLEDTVNVSATLGNCRGGIAGADLVGNANLNGSAISGGITLVGPRVSRGNLPPTGGDARLLLLGGGLLLGALVLGRKVRRSGSPA